MSNERPADPRIDPLEALYNDTEGTESVAAEEEAHVARAKDSVRADQAAAERAMVQDARDFAATRNDNYMGQVHRVLSEAERAKVSNDAQQAEVETARARVAAVSMPAAGRDHATVTEPTAPLPQMAPPPGPDVNRAAEPIQNAAPRRRGVLRAITNELSAFAHDVRGLWRTGKHAAPKRPRD